MAFRVMDDLQGTKAVPLPFCRVTGDRRADKVSQLLMNRFTGILGQGFSSQQAKTTEQVVHLNFVQARQVACHTIRHT